MRRTRVPRLQTTQQMKKMYEEEAGNVLQLRKISDEGSDKLPRIITPTETTGICTVEFNLKLLLCASELRRLCLRYSHDDQYRRRHSIYFP